MVFLEEELRFLREGRPVAGSVFLEDLDLPAEEPAGLVDLVDGRISVAGKVDSQAYPAWVSSFISRETLACPAEPPF